MQDQMQSLNDISTGVSTESRNNLFQESWPLPSSTLCYIVCIVKNTGWSLHHSPLLTVALKEIQSKAEVKDTSSCQTETLEVVFLITIILRKFRCSYEPKYKNGCIFHCSFQCSVLQVLYFIFHPIKQQGEAVYKIYTHIYVCI